MIAIVRGMKLRVAKQRIGTNSVEIIFENKNKNYTHLSFSLRCSFLILFFFALFIVCGRCPVLYVLAPCSLINSRLNLPTCVTGSIDKPNTLKPIPDDFFLAPPKKTIIIIALMLIIIIIIIIIIVKIGLLICLLHICLFISFLLHCYYYYYYYF